MDDQVNPGEVDEIEHLLEIIMQMRQIQILREQLATTSICFICMDELEDKYETLLCGHKFCQMCLGEFINTVFNKQSYDITDLYCPACQRQIEFDQLKSILSKEQLAAFQQKSFEQNQVLDLPKDEILVSCPQVTCKNKVVIWKEADYFKCNVCKIESCPKCQEERHQNLTCLQNKEKVKLVRSSALFNQKNTDFKMCPNCFQGIQKISGCNFITCQSGQCKGKKYFCYVCQLPLSKQDEFEHFDGRNPFTGACKVKVDNQWVLKPAKQLEYNLIPCPGCQNTKNKITIIEPSFNNVACTCMSVQCRGKIYCLKCKAILQGNILDKHIQVEFKCDGVIDQQQKKDCAIM